MRRSAIAVACVAAVSASVTGWTGQGGGGATPQTPPSLVGEVQGFYTSIKNNIVRSADQFPEDKFTWAPTPAVRSWARMLGHIADDNNGACFALAGLTERPARLETMDTPESAANKRKAPTMTS